MGGCAENSRNTIVGCYGDWHTISIAESLRQLGLLRAMYITYDIPRESVQLRSYARSWLGFRLKRRVGNMLGATRAMYQSRFIYEEFQKFDEAFSRKIKREDRYAFVWSGMASQSIRKAREKNVKSLLFVGSAHIDFQSAIRRSVFPDAGEIPEWWKQTLCDEYVIADQIIVESSFAKNTLVSAGIPMGKIAVLNPVVQSMPAIRSVSRSEAKPLILATVQLGIGKGTHLLIEWWKKLKLQKSELWLFGHWDSSLGTLDSLPEGIQFCGFLKGEKFLNRLRQVDICVFPTMHDGGPRSLFQCMSAGAFPITSEFCAGPDHIRNGISGFVIPLQDAAQWMEILKWCGENREKVWEMGFNARNHAEQYFNPTAHSRNLKDLLIQ
jgi:glycosyltransferase involved in cell wall biosynthesis